jgi:hypothetical protein
MKRKKVKFDFSITGFIIALLLIGMFTMVFSTLIVEVENNYNIDYNISLSKYDTYNNLNSSSNSLKSSVDDIKNATTISQKEGILDVIGGFFSSGYSALKTTLSSFSVYNSMMEDASSDVPELKAFTPYISAIVIIALFLGVAIAVLLKWKV